MRLIHERITDRRFFDFVPDYFTHRIEPLVVSRFVSRSTCNLVIKLNQEKNRRITTAPGEHKDRVLGSAARPNYRNSETVQNPYLALVQPMLSPSYIGRYVNEWWNLDEEYGWIPELHEPMYTTFSEGQYCRLHQDVVWGKNDVLERPTRRVSVILYLNDWAPVPTESGFTGGDLMFPSIEDEQGQCLSIKPKAGDLVLFPSNANYYHSVQRVTSGVRHNIVHWMRFKE